MIWMWLKNRKVEGNQSSDKLINTYYWSSDNNKIHTYYVSSDTSILIIHGCLGDTLERVKTLCSGQLNHICETYKFKTSENKMKGYGLFKGKFPVDSKISGRDKILKQLLHFGFLVYKHYD